MSSLYRTVQKKKTVTVTQKDQAMAQVEGSQMARAMTLSEKSRYPAVQKKKTVTETQKNVQKDEENKQRI
jgi:uncharacterized protein YgiM (DUF1202 family)